MENTSSNTYLTTNTSNFLNQSATLQMEFGQPKESLQAMGLMAQVHITSAYQSGVPVSFCNSGYITSGKHDLPKVWVNEEAMPESVVTAPKEKRLIERQYFESGRHSTKGATMVAEGSEEEEEDIDFDEDF